MTTSVKIITKTAITATVKITIITTKPTTIKTITAKNNNNKKR